MAKLYTRKSDGTYVPYNPQSVTNIDVVQTTGNSVTAAMSQDAVTKKLATKQDTLTLTIKDNGNIVLSNIQGQSKEFMPATPSGDPMHYAYEAAGAVWNGTGADIVKTAPWADLADDDADKTVVHKAGYWYLNGLGDITTEQMRDIYNNSINFGNLPSLDEALSYANVRTNFFINHKIGYATVSAVATFTGSKLEVVRICNDEKKFLFLSDIGFLALNNKAIKHFIGTLHVSSGKRLGSAFSGCSALKTIRIQYLKLNIDFNSSPLLTSKSILYIINNEQATSAITITLHADAYARAMANADIVAALEAHPNVSLASA